MTEQKVIEGDVLSILPTMEPESFDAIVTDPPYGIDFQSCRVKDAAQRKSKIANDKAPYIWFLPGAYRVLRNGGTIHVFCRWDVQSAFRQALEWAGFSVKSEVIWNRMVHGMGDLHSAYAPMHDTILFATKGTYTFPCTRPKSVISVPRVPASRLMHPNEKPVALMQELLRVVPPGGRVLDPFCGSGSTLDAAQRCGLDSVGIELSPEYCQVARKRLGLAERAS